MYLVNSALLVALLLPASHLVHAQVLTDEFTVNCNPLTIQRSDPIVSPGVASGHIHIITGGTAFQRTMGPNTATNAKATTCDKTLDKSNYWIPQLYYIRADGQFELVHMQGNVSSQSHQDISFTSNIYALIGCLLYELSVQLCRWSLDL
jgi:hypothetical protein